MPQRTVTRADLNGTMCRRPVCAYEREVRGCPAIQARWPGTGKTELCRLLARQLGVLLYEISSEDDEGDPISAKGRLMALRAAQSIFRSQSAILLIDEVETFLSDRRGANHAWEQSNEMLCQMETFEGIFLACTNMIDVLDPAALRRFGAEVHFDYLRPSR